MYGEKLSARRLLVLAEESGLAFSDFAGGVVLEEVVRCIAESAFSDCMWLRNSFVLGKEQYRQHLQLRLLYCFAAADSSKEDTEESLREHRSLLAQQLQELLEAEDRLGISFSVQPVPAKKSVQLEILGTIDALQVPICLTADICTDEKLVPKKEEFLPMLGEEISYYQYPAEKLLAEKFIEIITRMELLQDMGVYEEMYDLLNHESMDGRKVREYIAEACENLQISKNQTYMEVIAGYKNYGYMKKRWKLHLRERNRKVPSWDSVIERFVQFFTPVFRAYVEDEVFFGDWMPDLNRFL